jgi:hypothetical protein
MTTKPLLQEILQQILYTEDESKQNHKRIGSIKPQEKKRQVIRDYLFSYKTKTSKWHESPHTYQY